MHKYKKRKPSESKQYTEHGEYVVYIYFFFGKED